MQLVLVNSILMNAYEMLILAVTVSNLKTIKINF